MTRPRLVLLQGGKSEPQCYCDEPDVYDGWAECPVHPQDAP